jgi:hypothetical protein
MKHRFAKLFDLDEHQVLVTRRYNNEDGCYEMKVATLIDGVAASVGHQFLNEEVRDHAFEAFDRVSAVAFIRHMHRLETALTAGDRQEEPGT